MQVWTKKELGEICKLRNGRAYKKQELLSSGKYPVLRVGNFFTSNHWYHSDLELDDTKYCDKGDLLYAWSASFGPRIWNGEKSIFHYHIWRVDHDETEIAKKFLFYWFEWDAERIKKDQGAGTTMVHVSMKSMNARSISFPSLPEQERIVTILDEVTTAIAMATANAEQSLTSVRELFETYRNQAINRRDHSWPSVSLEDVCPRFEYGTSAKSQTTGRVPVLRMGNIQDGEIDWSDLVYSSDPAEIQKYLLRPNDILFNRTNSPEHVGKTAIVRGEREAIFAGYLIRIHWDPKRLDPGYLNHFLNSQMARGHGKTVMSGSVNQANISGSKLKRYSILLPPVDKQKTIAATLDSMKAQTSEAVSLYSSKLTLLTELKQSTLHKAFTGELTADFKADDVVLSKGEV